MNTPSTFIRRIAAGRRGAVRALTLVMVATSVAVIGCGDDPVAPSSDFEARGIALQIGSVDTVIVDATSLQGSLQVEAGAAVENIGVQFIRMDGTRGVPGSGYSLGWTVADTSIASIESSAAWQFRLVGKKEGSTTVTFQLMKGANAIYTSGAVPIEVAGGAGFAMGDTLVYNFYDRDMANNRIEASRQRKTWYVLRTGITYEDSTGVTEILEVTSDANGSMELERDTIYMRTAADGAVYQYDMLRSLLGRVEGAELLGDLLPAQWVRIGSVMTEGTGSWFALGVDSIDVSNVNLPGVPVALSMGLRMDASHKGKMGVTVPAGAYDDAFRTDHSLRLNVRPAGFPISALFDSVMVRFDISAKDGLINRTFQSKVMTAELLGQSQDLPVVGYEMELVSYKRAK